jgi:hypothetical protein
MQVVAALHAAGSLACSLNCREQQSHQDSNNCDDDQQFDECKRELPSKSRA